MIGIVNAIFFEVVKEWNLLSSFAFVAMNLVFGSLIISIFREFKK